MSKNNRPIDDTNIDKPTNNEPINTQQTSPVEPIQTVQGSVPAPAEEPSVDSEQYQRFLAFQKMEAQAASAPAETVMAATPPTPDNTQIQVENCWNCANQGKNNPLDLDGNCEVCGFEKHKLYNGNIEQEKARQRILNGVEL